MNFNEIIQTTAALSGLICLMIVLLETKRKFKSFLS